MSQINVVHAIIKKEGRYLLGKRSLTKKCGPGYWATIGGRIEGAESLEHGVVRECLEEIGIQVKPIRKVAQVRESEATHHWIVVELVSGNPHLASDENSELRWVTLAEMEELEPLTSDDLQIIKSLVSF